MNHIQFVFEELEDLENKENLVKIFEIIKSIGKFPFDYNSIFIHIFYYIIRLMFSFVVFTDDGPFLELLLSDEYYLFIFGAFECLIYYFK